MPWVPQDITSAELEILKRLWEQGPTTIRELTDQLYPDGTHAQYATVQSLLGRLEDKGHVKRKKEGRVNVFRARVTRRDVIAKRLRDTAETLCDGAMAPLLSHLVERADLGDRELEALRALVDRLDREGNSETAPERSRKRGAKGGSR